MLRSESACRHGKPEPVKHNLSGLWPKYISQKDRLIYKFIDNSVHIFAIDGRYDQHEKI